MSQADASRKAEVEQSAGLRASTMIMGDAAAIRTEMAFVRRRLGELRNEQADLESVLAVLEKRLIALETVTQFGPFAGARVTNQSPSSVKVALFRSLFTGRSDVFPVRWENRNSGRAGYSPACSNEWARGICAKPKVKCGECPHQAFIPVSDEIITRHLHGRGQRSADFVAGVYPLLADGTCWFLAADFDEQDWAEDARAFVET